jgi:hypothetical protein
MQLQSYSLLQADSPCLSSSLPRPALVARWEIEDGRLICRWIVDDRPYNSSHLIAQVNQVLMQGDR